MKIFFNQETNELFIRGRYCASFDGNPQAIKIMKCFDEERYPMEIFDPIAPPAIMNITEEARNHIHNLEIDRILSRMNGELSIRSEAEGWKASPAIFLHDSEEGKIMIVDTHEIHPESLDVV